MSKLIEAHRMLAKSYELSRDAHTLIAEHHLESTNEAAAPAKETKKRNAKTAEPALPAASATPEATTASAQQASASAAQPQAAAAPNREAIRDTKLIPFAKQSQDNTAKVKHLLSQFGVGKFQEVPDEKLGAFETALDALINPANDLDL